MNDIKEDFENAETQRLLGATPKVIYKPRKKSKGNEKKVFSIRVRPSMIAQLRAIAKEDDRSMNNVIERVLQDYLNKIKTK